MKVTTDACLFGAWICEIIKTKNISAVRGLDIGTGTGVLSLMLAQTTSMHIDAIEIDRNAFAQASENIGNSPWATRIKTTNVSLQMFEPNQKYDIIFSNPPFYENDLRSPNMAKNRAMHDTSLTIQDLFDFSTKHMSEEGHLFMLLPGKREVDVLQKMQLASLHLRMLLRVKQTTKNEGYFRIMLCCSKTNTLDKNYHELTIRDEKNQYSPTYNYLLNSFYL